MAYLCLSTSLYITVFPWFLAWLLFHRVNPYSHAEVPYSKKEYRCTDVVAKQLLL